MNACLTGTTEEHLRSLKIADLSDRLRTLERGGLIEKSGQSYAFAFPTVVGPKRARLQRYTEQVATQLLPSTENMVGQIRRHLRDRQEMLYHVLWSCIMDGPSAWNVAKAEMGQQVEAGDTSIEDKAWLICPPHRFAVGTNSYDLSCGHLRITWNRNTPDPHTIRRVIAQYEDDLSEAIRQGRPVTATITLREVGLVDDSGTVRIYTLDSERDSSIIRDYTRLGKDFGRQVMAHLDTADVSDMLEAPPGVAFLIAYHEICWQLLQDLIAKEVLIMPAILQEEQPNMAEACQLVSLVRDANTPSLPPRH